MSLSKNMPPPTTGFGTMFIKNQFLTRIPPPPKGTDLSGKVAIVTGASSGLGLESARQLLGLGLSHLVIAVRSVERGRTAASELQLVNPQATIDVWPLDMESYQSVQNFAHRCDTDLPRIDMVILNAGVAEAEFSIVPSTGHERVMQVNYHSTILLVILFLPMFKAKSRPGSPPRLTIINSGMSEFTKFSNRDKRPLLASFDDTKITPWDPEDRYGLSKLIGQLFLSRLAERISPDDVVINMVEPGLTKTNLFRHSRGVSGAVFDLIKSIAARPAQKSALTYVDAAAVKGKESHGCLLVLCQIAPLATFLYQPEAESIIDQVWEETLDELSFVGARDIIQSFGKQM